MRWVGDEAGLTLPADRKPAAHASRVLIADDNADLRKYITRLLQDLCDVTAVGDGEQALAALSGREFDLLITDVMMPTVDGFELLRPIRSGSEHRTLQVIMLSARAGEESRIDGLEHGADDYIVKPFAARELVAKVAHRLGLAGARRHMLDERHRLRELLSQVPVAVNFLAGHTWCSSSPIRSRSRPRAATAPGKERARGVPSIAASRLSRCCSGYTEPVNRLR